MTTASTQPEPLLAVTARAAARYLHVSRPVIDKAESAGLLRPAAQPEGGLDAESVLALGRRPWLDPAAAMTGAPGPVLIVQMAPAAAAGEHDEHWRRWTGWSADLSDEQAAAAAAGWWRLADPAPLIGVIAVLATAVVSVAETLRDETGSPVAEHVPGGALRLHTRPAGDETASDVARWLHTTFTGRRLPGWRGGAATVLHPTA
jgi:hypothetical protein